MHPAFSRNTTINCSAVGSTDKKTKCVCVCVCVSLEKGEGLGAWLTVGVLPQRLDVLPELVWPQNELEPGEREVLSRCDLETKLFHRHAASFNIQIFTTDTHNWSIIKLPVV